MWRFGTDADVAVRDQAVRAGGGSRGELMVPLYSARWALVSPLFCTSWGGGSHEPGGEAFFHALVMREGSLEVKWQGASTRGFSLRIDELFLLG